MARRVEIVPEGLVKSLSFNELTLFMILGNATKPLDQNELQARYDAAFGTTTWYNEMGTMIRRIRSKGYVIDSKKFEGYWLPEVAAGCLYITK